MTHALSLNQCSSDLFVLPDIVDWHHSNFYSSFIYISLDAPKETKTLIMWMKDSTYDYLLMLSTMFKPELGLHPTAKTYSIISNKLSVKYQDNYDVESLKSKFHRMRKDYKGYLLVQSHTGLGWDEATQTVSCPNAVKQHFIEVTLYYPIKFLL